MKFGVVLGGTDAAVFYGDWQGCVADRKEEALLPCELNRPILCGQYKKEACKG